MVNLNSHSPVASAIVPVAAAGIVATQQAAYADMRITELAVKFDVPYERVSAEIEVWMQIGMDFDAAYSKTWDSLAAAALVMNALKVPPPRPYVLSDGRRYFRQLAHALHLFKAWLKDE